MNARKGKCAFCEITSGEGDAAIVAEDEGHMAFLDKHPLNPGHCLVVPKSHAETTDRMTDRAFAALMVFANSVVRAVESALDAGGSFIAINNRISQSVPHLHVHVVPRFRNDGLFSRKLLWIRKSYANRDHLAETARKIAEAWREGRKKASPRQGNPSPGAKQSGKVASRT